ncbi:MAG: DUF5320 domain-containing protein [bacterium]
MPRGDGTGPKGMGPRTGGGFGFCGSSANAGAAEELRGVGQGGFPRGGGRGNCYGGGRGMGRRGFGFRGRASQQDEKTILSNRAIALESELAATRERIESLDKNTGLKQE